MSDMISKGNAEMVPDCVMETVLFDCGATFQRISSYL